MGRPNASPTSQVSQQTQEYHFQSVSQSPETIDDAPPPFETCNDENQQESTGSEPSEVSKKTGESNQHSSQTQQQSHSTRQAVISSIYNQTQEPIPMAFPPQSSQVNAQFLQNHQMRSPTGAGGVQPPQPNPQAFPPQASSPQSFPTQPQAFPPVQNEPQAFPPHASSQAFPPQAFPPQADQNPQAFPPPEGESQAFPPPQGKEHVFPPKAAHHQPQAFPPAQDIEPQAFPPKADHHQPQAFPPAQDEPQAFPPKADLHQPQAFPPAQDQPQAFPPPVGQPQAFPPQQATFQQQQNGMQFPQQSNFFHQSAMGGQMGAQAMPASPFHPSPQTMMNNATPGFPVIINQNPIIQVPTESWKTGLFECMNDPTNALVTACFPCVTFGQIAEIIDSGQTSCATSGLLYGAIAFFIAMPCLMSCTYRTKLRGRLGLIETPAPDWVIHCFCECCALCQEYRELKERALDPSIGWLGNKQKQMVQLALTTPPMRQTMMG